MIEKPRPDLSGLPTDVVDYIEYLEQQVLNSLAKATSKRAVRSAAPPEPSEPPTPINIVVLTRNGLIKRTPRHLYSRQNRSGMGNFDIQLEEDDEPYKITSGDENEDLILLTNFARIFRLPLDKIPAGDTRQRGIPLTDYVNLHPKEHVVEALGGDGAHLAMLTAKGFVICRNKHYLKDGAILFDTNEIQQPIAACWSTGNDDLLIGTQRGKGLRFSMRQVPQRGCLGIRLEEGDRLLGLAAAAEDGGVALMTADGKGTVRLMSGLRQNKAPGAGGKVLIKSDQLIGMAAIRSEDDIFLLSRLSKMIRFRADDIPPKEGVVQGVNCMALRSDEVMAFGVSAAS